MQPPSTCILTDHPSVALQDIEDDEVLFTIPRSAVLNMSTILNSAVITSISKAIIDMPNWLVRASNLSTEK